MTDHYDHAVKHHDNGCKPTTANTHKVDSNYKHGPCTIKIKPNGAEERINCPPPMGKVIEVKQPVKPHDTSHVAPVKDTSPVPVKTSPPHVVKPPSHR
ncbi:MAG: hypothetical protein WBY44_34105 [Bryobacteraceae bacterium]